jgi:serine/threonine-protein kinase
MSDDTKIGTDIGGYRILRLLGRGGMSVVYLAEDLRLGRNVAVKVIAPDLAADEGVRDRFLRESNAAASLDDPNVLPIYGAGDADGVLYIAMRYVDGTDLKALIEREGPLDPDRAVSIVSQVASALDAAHDRGLVHRDVKPGNVLLGRPRGGEHAYLTDFGLIKRRDRSTGLTRTGQFIGTLDYVAPEQVKGGEVDLRADVYSLGCLLYECLTGEPPYIRDTEVATMYAHLEDPPPSVAPKRPELPAGIDAVVARAMAKDPENRYGTAGDLAQDAKAVLGTREAAPPSTPARSRRTFALVVGGIAAVVAIVVAIAVLTRGGGTSPGASGSPTAQASHAAVPPASSLVEVDPDEGTVGKVVAHLPTACPIVRANSVRIVAGEDAVWWRGCGSLLTHIDVDSGRTEATIQLPFGLSRAGDVIVASRTVWTRGGQDIPTMERIDPATDERLRAVKFSGSPALTAFSFGEGRVWTGFADGTLVGLDPATGSIEDRYRIDGSIDDVAVGSGSVWCLDEFSQTVSRVDPETGSLMARIRLAASFTDIVAGRQGIWVLSSSVGTVLQIDASSNEAGLPVRVGDTPTDIVEGLGAVWISDLDGSVWRVDPITSVASEFPVGTPLGSIAVDAKNRVLWVATVERRS